MTRDVGMHLGNAPRRIFVVRLDRVKKGLLVELHIPFILNPAPAPLSDISDILPLVDILCPNKNEAEALTGIKILNLQDAKRAGNILRDRGVKDIILTLGKSGAFVVTKDKEELVPSPAVVVTDTTGAGDAFIGALALSLALEKPLYDAVRFANAAAAISVTKVGTQAGLPTSNEVEELKNQFFLESKNEHLL